jgi:hypothetical protein
VWDARADTPPNFPLCSPRAPAELEKTPVPHSAAFCAQARAPLLLHRLCVHLIGSCRRRPPLPLRFSSERHRCRRFTVRPFHLPSLSPFEAALTFPLLHRHCKVVRPTPPTTGAASPPLNAAARSILPRELIGSALPPTSRHRAADECTAVLVPMSYAR